MKYNINRYAMTKPVFIEMVMTWVNRVLVESTDPVKLREAREALWKAVVPNGMPRPDDRTCMEYMRLRDALDRAIMLADRGDKPNAQGYTDNQIQRMFAQETGA